MTRKRIGIVSLGGLLLAGCFSVPARPAHPPAWIIADANCRTWARATVDARVGPRPFAGTGGFAPVLGVAMGAREQELYEACMVQSGFRPE